MTEWLLALVPAYGNWLIIVTVFLGCLALPVPASILLIAAGGFAAAGDLSLATTALVALGSAAAGDQVVYFAGRWRGRRVIEWLGARAAPVTKASAMLERRGGFAVFLSRWLIPALGPYVNLAAGGSGLGWVQFTLWGLAGEAVWVALYIGLGYAFMGNLAAASDMALNVVAVLGTAAVSIALGIWLVRRHRAARRILAPAGQQGTPAE